MSDQTGFVEHVGLRSTHLRTFDDSVVVIPNRVLAGEIIDNRGRRRHWSLRGTIGLTYDTTPDELETFVDALRKLVANETDGTEDGIYVGVRDFGESAIEVRFTTHLDADDYGAMFHARNELWLSIARLVERHGLEFAFPTQTVHLAPWDDDEEGAAQGPSGKGPSDDAPPAPASQAEDETDPVGA